MKVLLPAPFGPMIADCSPSCMEKFTCRVTWMPPKCLCRSVTSRIAAMAHCCPAAAGDLPAAPRLDALLDQAEHAARAANSTISRMMVPMVSGQYTVYIFTTACSNV